MFDTYLTVTGNALTAPEWRRTATANVLLANFKIASTSRRYDRASGKWIDGETFRVRVICWRRLAEGVCASVMVGDPVIVHGRLYTRDWIDDNNEHRVTYELEAVAVGHDLAKGRSRFERRRPQTSTASVEDAEAEMRVGGERTLPVAGPNAPEPGGDDFPDEDPYTEDFDRFPPTPDANFDAMVALREAGLDTDPLSALDERPPYGRTALDEPGRDEEPDGDGPGGDGPAGDADETGAAGGPEDGEDREAGAGTRGRGRRQRARQPVPA